MIRKMIHMEVPARQLLDIFADSENWTKWMPGMKKTTFVRGDEKRHTVFVEGTYAGVKFSQEMDVTRGHDTVKQVQKEGWPVRWGVTWRCIPPPSGTGTTVVAEVEMEFAPLAPKKMIMKMLRKMVGDMMSACKKRAEGLNLDRGEAEAATPPKPSAPGQTGDRILLSVYQTEKGLEVVVGDQTFVIAQ